MSFSLPLLKKKKSLRFGQATWCNMAEDRKFCIHMHENLKHHDVSIFEETALIRFNGQIKK
jgi:hypothetical protein